MINRVILVGNVVEGSRAITEQSGEAEIVTGMSFQLETVTSWKDGAGKRHESREVHNVDVEGRMAEICNEYATDGKRVYVEGRLRTVRRNGQTQTQIVAETIKLLQPRFVGAA